MALYYPSLGRLENERIWRSNLNRVIKNKQVNQQRLILTDNGEETIRYAMRLYDWNSAKRSTIWNGRQIRNSFQTAVALAEFDAKKKGTLPTLDWSHFQHVVMASAHFERYLYDTRGYSETEIADATGIRADYDIASTNFRGDDQGTRRVPHNKLTAGLYDEICNIRPDSVLNLPSSTTKNPFGTGLQRKPSLNQRMSGAMRPAESSLASSQHASIPYQGAPTHQPFRPQPSHQTNEPSYSQVQAQQPPHLSQGRPYDQSSYSYTAQTVYNEQGLQHPSGVYGQGAEVYGLGRPPPVQ